MTEIHPVLTVDQYHIREETTTSLGPGRERVSLVPLGRADDTSRMIFCIWVYWLNDFFCLRIISTRARCIVHNVYIGILVIVIGFFEHSVYNLS